MLAVKISKARPACSPFPPGVHHLRRCIMLGLPRNSLRTHPEVLHWRGSLKGHPFPLPPSQASQRPGHHTYDCCHPTRPFIPGCADDVTHISQPRAPSVMSAQSRLPKAGEVRGVAPPLTHCRPGIAGVAEGPTDRWGYCKVTHIGRIPDRRLSEAAEEWGQGSGGGGPRLTQVGPQLH